MTDGLIDPDAFVCRAEGLDPEAIFEAGSEIWAIGSNISNKVHGVDRVWQDLRGVYHSPDEESVYGVMKPAIWSAALIRGDLAESGKAIQAFAEELREIKPALEKVEQEAREFRTEALEGYLEWVGNIRDDSASGYTPEELSQMGLGEGPWRQQKTHWRRHQHAVDRNNDLLAQYNKLFEQVVNAARTCENTIRQQGDHQESCLPTAPGVDPGFHEIGEYPWGTKVEKEARDNGESILRGIANTAKEAFFGGMAHVGMDENGNFSLEHAAQTWSATGHFWLLTGQVVLGGLTVQRIGEEDPEYTEKFNEAATLWGDLINWDHQAHLAGKNGWHAYEEDPVQAWTETILGLGTVGFGGRMLLRRAGVPRGLPGQLIPGFDRVTKVVDNVTQPIQRFREGVIRFGFDHVVSPLEQRLHNLATKAREGVDNLTDPWRNTAPAGAGRGPGGNWQDHTTFNQAHDARHGSNHHTPSLDDGPAPRRAARPVDIDVPEADPPKRTDRYGNDLIVDDKGDPVIEDRGDGRLHYASDPEGTFRDNGYPHGLHSQRGKYTTNPYAPPSGDITDPAVLQGTLSSQHISGLYDQADQFIKDWASIRQEAVDARIAAADTPRAVEKWIPEAKSLTYKELLTAINDRLANEKLSDFELGHLERHRDIVDAALDARLRLQANSEWAGDLGGQKHLESQGHQVISGKTGTSPDQHDSPGRDEFDQAGISGPDITPPDAAKKVSRPERYEIAFQENKGGNVSIAQLGTRGGAQQGSLAYLKSILEAQNPNGSFLNDLKQLKASGKHPGFFNALERGEVLVRYQYANTRTNGTLRTGEFDLGGEVRLHWDGNNIFKLTPKEPR